MIYYVHHSKKVVQTMQQTQKRSSNVIGSMYSRMFLELLDLNNRYGDLWDKAMRRNERRPSWTIGGLIGAKRRGRA